MRTVYLGTSDFAVTVLERLSASDHTPALVLTRPDRPKGRGRKLLPPPVAEAARRLGLELDQPSSVNSEDARARIAQVDPDVVCICAFGGLIKEPLLSDYEMLNVHPSLLPRWRGAAPIARAIEAGDEKTGVTIMRPTAELDAGPICLQAEEPVRPDDDCESLAARLAPLSADLLLEALDRRPSFHDQPEEGATYADKIEAADRVLDPSRPAAELERKVRALHPHIGACVELPGGERLRVDRGAVAAVPDGLDPGALADNEGRLLFGCADGALELLEVRPAGGRSMDAAAYLRGRGSALSARG